MFAWTFRKLFSRKPKRTITNRWSSRPRLEALEDRITPAGVWTDYLDYSPGSTAIINGQDFAPGETVTLQVSRTDGQPDYPDGNLPWQVIDGSWSLDGGVSEFQPFVNDSGILQRPDLDHVADGSFQTTWYVEEQYAGASLQLTATGQDSGTVATTDFTDSVGSVTITATNPSATVASGGTVSLLYDFTYDTGGSGGNLTTDVTYRVYLRTGSTNYGPFVTQNVTGLSAGTHSVTGNVSVTFDGLGSNPPTTTGAGYKLRIEVTRNDGGTGANPATATSTADWVTVQAVSGSVASVAVGAQTGTRTYGDTTGNVTYFIDATRGANGNFTGNYSISGLPSGVTLVSFSPTAGDATGSAPLVDSTLTLQVANTLPANSYNFTVTLGGVNGTGTLVVNKAHLTVTADAKSKTYDGSVYSPFTATISGFVNSETDAGLRGTGALGGNATFSGVATTAVNAGTYTNGITPAVGTLSATNYDFPAGNFNSGTLTIDKVHLTVTADSKNKDYDGSVYSPFTATISGFVNSETDAGLRGSGALSGNATFSGVATTAVNAGTYTNGITPAVGTLLATNYDFPAGNFNSGTLTINKVHLTVTADAKSKDYDGSVYSPFTATISGFVNSETDAGLRGSGALAGNATFSGAATTAVNAGTYTNGITPAVGTLSATNYDFPAGNFNSGTLTIDKVHLTVTADAKSKDYDGSVYSPFTATITGFVNSETDAGLRGSGASAGNATFSGAATTAVNAGTYTNGITPAVGSLLATNYDFPAGNFNSGTLTINKVHLTVTADAKSKNYDGSVYSPFTATITGFVNSETDAGLRGSGALSGNATFSGAATTAVNAGTYTNGITPAVGTLSATNYDFPAGNFVNGTLTINKVHLTVTADAKSKDYDGSVYSPFTATISGFVNSETDAGLRGSGALAGNATFSGAATTAVNAGTYTNGITPAVGTLSATNYDFPAGNFVSGTLTIDKVHLTVTADAKNKDYDGSVYSPFTATISGFVNSETDAGLRGSGALAGNATFSGAATTAVNAGTYTNGITPAVGTLSATNYDFPAGNFNSGTLTIDKVHLTVTADAKSKDYDGSVYSPFTATISGFVNSETDAGLRGSGALAGNATFSGAATTAVNAGTYTNGITPAVGSLLATNYDFPAGNFNSGTLTINKVHLTVTADAKSKDYDGSVYSPFTATISGFVNSETDAGLRGSGALSGNATYSGVATTAVNAGTYTNGITPAVGTLSATNYDFPAGNFVSGTLTINKVHLTVTADAKSKNYDGSVYSPFTATISGFVNSETDAGLRGSGALSGNATFSGAATTAVNAGTYTNGITPAVGTLSATNYDFPAGNFVSGTLTINKVHLTVTADAKSKDYDGSVYSPFTATISGFVTSETDAGLRGSGALSGNATYSGVATTAVNAGTYTNGITPAVGSLLATNYDFPAGNFVSGTLTINKVHLTVTADAKSKDYDGSVYSPFTATISGFVNSETDAGLRGSGALSGNATYSGVATTAVNAGTYTNGITPAVGSLLATNYDFPAGNFVSGTLTIKKINATWTTSNNSKVYLAADPVPLTTGSGSGFVAADGVYAAYTRVPGESVGGYHIMATLHSPTLTDAEIAQNYTITNTGATFTIVPRAALVNYIGQTMWTTGSTTSNSTAQVTLTASMQDTTGHDLVNAKVDFIDALSGKVLASGVKVSPVAGSPSTGTANTIVTLTCGTYGSQDYVILVRATSGYDNSAQTIGKTATIVVTKLTNANEICGGGTIARSTFVAGTYGVTSSGPVTYSVGLNYNKSLTNLQGKISLEIPQTDGSTIYVKSNSLSSMSVKTVGTTKYATVYAKASIYRIDALGAMTTIDGNVTLRLDVVDYAARTGYGADSLNDEVGFTVLSTKTSQMYYSNDWELDTTTNAWKTKTQKLASGSIKIG